MDFVVAGLGIGALMVVIGFVVRDIGPIIGHQNRTPQEHETSEQRNRARARFHEIAEAMSIGGGVIIVATLFAVVLGLSDSAGTIIMLVAAVAGIGYAAVAIARILLGHEGGLPVGVPRVRGRSLTLTRGADPAAAGTGPAPAVRRVEKKPSEKARSTELAVVPKNLTPDEPFDATRLLPYEFDEAYASGSRMPGHSDDAVGTQGSASEPEVASSKPEVETVEEQLSVATAEGAETRAVTPIAELPAGKRVFKSALLADIGLGPDRETAEGAFTSRLLAGVDPDENVAETYRSSLFADLEPGMRAGSTEADDPDATTEPEADSSDDDEAAAKEPAIDDAAGSSTTPERG